MEEKIIYQLESLYRTDLRIRAFNFGDGPEKVCIVGSLRGNELQQMYIASLIVKKLKEYEEKGYLTEGHQITVIPCANTYSINQGKRFWPEDDTDINRMFPGYYEGETTQRIAEGIFDAIKDYTYGIQLTSSYLTGMFSTHIRMMQTGSEDTETAKAFGLPYIFVRKARPYDTTTLNYNWQVWDCKAFSLYTRATEIVDETIAKEARNSILRFLNVTEFITKPMPGGYQSQIIEESRLTPIMTTSAGFFETVASLDDEVQKGDVLAKIYNPFDHSVQEELRAPTSGMVFYLNKKDLVYAHSLGASILV